MKLHLALLLLLAPFFFSSCGDSPDKLAKDQYELIEDMTKIMNKVADGSMSSSDAAKKIKELGKKSDELAKRSEAMKKELTPEKTEALEKKYKDKSQKAFREYMAALDKLIKSGRMNQELSDAVENMRD